MKKILSILSCAALLFTACTETIEVIEPVFPEEVVEMEILAGESKGIEIDANASWTVNFAEVAAEQYAYLIGPDGVKATEISGEPGKTRIFVETYEGIKNYDADIVFHLNLTMLNETQPIAKFTIKKIEKPASIVATETFETVTLAEGGHPSWGGEFANAAEKWSLAYTDKWDLEGVGMQCNLENVASITVHAYNAGGSIADVSTFTDPWVEVSTFGTQGGFKVIMDVTKDSAAWSLNTQTNTYEAYVNFSDAEGNILLSLYCTYKAPEESSEGAISLASDMAGMMQVALSANTDGSYTWTLGMSDLLTMPSYYMHQAIKIADYKQASFAQENLQLVYDEEGGYYYVTLAEGATVESLSRENTLTIYESNYQSTIVNVVFSWIAGGTPTTEIKFAQEVDAMVATCVQLTAGNPDFDAENASVPQAKITYHDRTPLTNPTAYALTGIPSYAQAMANGTYYTAFWVHLNSDGNTIIEVDAEGGYTADTLPKGTYYISFYDATFTQIVAIVVLEIKTEAAGE